MWDIRTPCLKAVCASVCLSMAYCRVFGPFWTKSSPLFCCRACLRVSRVSRSRRSVLIEER